MESLEQNSSLTPGEQKIEEYVLRIKNGESSDSIFEGLPDSFISSIKERLTQPSNKDAVDEIPPQYQGLDSETLDFIWTFPEYIDKEKTKELKDAKARVLAALRTKESLEKEARDAKQHAQNRMEELREQLGTADPISLEKTQENESVFTKPEEPPMLSIEGRKELQGWAASYELAKIAKQQNIDLSKISREEYADFAIQNSLAIDDDQLRVAPWQRMGTSVEEIVLTNKELKSNITDESEKAFAKFCYDIQQKAGSENRFLSENVRVRQGTKDSNSWLFFGINDGINEEGNETFKSYISVKDLNTLTPERFTAFMLALRDAQYNGDIKIFQDMSEQGIRLNDQIVMHGGSQTDAELALRVAEQFFGSDIDQKSLGKDEVIDGKNHSYSQVLAQKIRTSIK